MKTHKSKKVTVRETLMDGVVMIGNPLLHKVKSTGKVFFFACLFLINVFRILDIDQWLIKIRREFIQQKWLWCLTCLSSWKSAALQSQWTPAASSHWRSQMGLEQPKMSHSWKIVIILPIWQLSWKTPLTELAFILPNWNPTQWGRVLP